MNNYDMPVVNMFTDYKCVNFALLALSNKFGWYNDVIFFPGEGVGW